MKNNKTVLQNLDIVNTIHKFDKWSCGCDYLRLCYKCESDFIEDSINRIDSDNSNFFIENIGDYQFTIQKGYCSLGVSLTFTISYNDISIPCCQFVKYNEHNSYLFNSYGKFDFYGSMFRLIDIGFFQKSIILLLKVKISEEDPSLTRFDYRLDFFSLKNYKIPEIKDFIKYLHVQSKTEEYRSGNELTNWLVGSKTSGKYAIRYYDKLIDTDKKQKVFLYQDYFLYNSVHRLEFEFQSNFLRGYNFYDFYNGVVEQRINIILGLSDDLFKGPLFYQYQSDYILQEKDKSKYLRRYSTASVRLAKNKINPLIQCYKSLFYELEESELQKNVCDFLSFVGQDKNLFKIRYDYLKQEFLNLHNS